MRSRRTHVRDDLPPAVADYVALVRQFNAGGELSHYPGSPTLAQDREGASALYVLMPMRV